MDALLLSAILGASPAEADHGRLVSSEDRFVLVTVLETKGSVPRHAGAKMLARRGATAFGTIGGGSLEVQALAATLECAVRGEAGLLQAEMFGKDALSGEMICGGSSLLLIEPLEDFRAYARALSELGKGRRFLLVKCIEARADPDGIPARNDGALPSAKLLFCRVSVRAFDEELRSLSEEGFDEAAARQALASGALAFREELPSSGARIAYDPFVPEEKLLILGGGHVGRAVAAIAPSLGFSVTVVDDRPELADSAAFPVKVAVLRSGYAEAVEHFPCDRATYAVVLTRGHLYDLECVRALLKKKSRYIGMIGSARKTQMIRSRLVAEGFEQARIDAIHAPIGLDIGAETPAEIAVAIVAELIAVRRCGLAGLKPRR